VPFKSLEKNINFVKEIVRMKSDEKRDKTTGDVKQEKRLPEEKRLILSRWQGFEDDGSSGCYNYNFKS
jgi:hypothetical protein